ncbi:hypothetical protein WA171_003247 [Blastocystis sp. BT1]
MIHESLFVIIFCLCTGIQYVEIARSIDPIDVSSSSMNESFVVHTDDVPFEKILLPFSFRFYDKQVHAVWITPNGYISLKPGFPCHSYFSEDGCTIKTYHYEAFIAPYLCDLYPISSSVASIRYRIEPHRLIVVWENVYNSRYTNLTSFMVVIHESGSIVFCYKQFSYPFVGSGLVGIRPFYRYSNYSTRSTYLSSGEDDWDTSLMGNYLPASHFATIYRKQQSSQTFIFNDVAYFFLAPTELCVTPSTVLQNIPTNITVSFSWLDPQLPVEYLRCEFGAITATSVIRISSSQLLCVTPNFTDIFSGSRLYSVTLSVFSPLLSSWSNIRTTSDSFIRVYAIGSTIPTINPDACEENGSCDLCGICIHNSTQEESNQCVGVDGVVYGQPKNECSIDEIRDKNGVCCLPVNIDCEGTCNGTMVAGYSWNSFSYICCSREELDCMNICSGFAVLDDCGVCSGGTSGHIANSDKNCEGVCFGSNTEGCSIVMEVSQSVFNFTMGVTNGDFTDSMIAMFNNTSSYEAILDSQAPALLNNGVFPSLTISYFLLNQTQHISIDLSRYTIPPHSAFYASITASSEELISRITPQLQHRKQQSLKLMFTPVNHDPSKGYSINLVFNFDIKGCELVSSDRICSLLPHCFSCFYSIDSSLKTKWFATSLLSSKPNSLQHYPSETTLYMGCTHGDEVSSCAYYYDDANRIQQNVFAIRVNQEYGAMFSLVCAFVLLVMTVVVVIDLIQIHMTKCFFMELSALSS